MATIQLLTKETIDQIAAGEVVERPASVVKELVENAIDAGATAITVEIRDGGIARIRVTDNGEGIAPDQVETAFLRHATSKIRGINDLSALSSLGFRGEALSSIAAVARVTCTTRTPDALAGTLFRIDGGVEQEKEEVGVPVGTTILIEDLFYNTPARRKFLLSAGTEAGRVRTVVEELALSHPEVAFTFLNDGRTQLTTSGRGDRLEILYTLYGREIAQQLLPVSCSNGELRIDGFLGTPQIARGNRSCERFFVNGRAIHSDLLQNAVEEGYHGTLMQHRFPFAVLFLQIDGALVDVNVHPAKREVRFHNASALYERIVHVVADRLHETEQIPEATLTPAQKKPAALPKMPRMPEPFETKRREETFAQGTERASEQINLFAEEPAGYSAPPAPEEEPVVPMLSPEARPHYRLIGQVFDTFWLLEYREQLYIVDQHAAHEKVLYEQLMHAYREHRVSSQSIFPAKILEPGTADAERLRTALPALHDLGFSIEEFGGDSFKVDAVPYNLYRVDPDVLFTDLLDQWHAAGSLPAESILERLASMSCKAAVKGNQRLSIAEAEALLDELLTLEDPYHCPHGRPTIITMTREELDRSFKRIV